MMKIYTAQEMRKFADAIAGDLNESGHTSVSYTFDDLIPVIESLRQAADTLEREQKYEYTCRYGKDIIDDRHVEDVKDCFAPLGAVIVRRPVGEWEEV